uniref:Uncharacterized protein n=1 Tax=Chromera velia CCMP2878 TaxID=1169474 RepID=A0A0G4GL83_9ALVE|eukprot:Cvel_4869.t1-p1 / transcript=Cvel_4869.t1 / gene=Cvel_4869 / organism=Chromera_velia_CCMP2878 / gene_product=hypothetical protein / transcript_product=hypothetical protein / location=Cvel_scaffold219:109872-111380(-) / protein_length=341 / sequence_SO=supercontig / SO=protein_coding / is_pseudo=false
MRGKGKSLARRHSRLMASHNHFRSAASRAVSLSLSAPAPVWRELPPNDENEDEGVEEEDEEVQKSISAERVKEMEDGKEGEGESAVRQKEDEEMPSVRVSLTSARSSSRPPYPPSCLSPATEQPPDSIRRSERQAEKRDPDTEEEEGKQEDLEGEQEEDEIVEEGEGVWIDSTDEEAENQDKAKEKEEDEEGFFVEEIVSHTSKEVAVPSIGQYRMDFFECNWRGFKDYRSFLPLPEIRKCAGGVSALKAYADTMRRLREGLRLYKEREKREARRGVFLKEFVTETEEGGGIGRGEAQMVVDMVEDADDEGDGGEGEPDFNGGGRRKAAEEEDSRLFRSMT